MKKTLITLISIFIVTATFAQENTQYIGNYNGFMGRRVLLNMEMSMAPGFTKAPNFRGNIKYWAFNYLLQPNIEIIAHRRGTVGANFTWFKTKFISYDYFDPTFKDLVVYGAGAFYKLYLQRDALAPMGQYLRFHFDYMRYGFDDTSTANPGLTFRNAYGFKFEYGRDFLFMDFLKLNVGLSIGCSFPGLRIFTLRDDYEDWENAANRICRNYFVGVNIGVGFLTF